MRNLKTYKLFLEYYSDIKNKIDEILDKISSHGIESLTPEERSLLDSQKEGDEASEEAYSKLSNSIKSKNLNREFESEDGRFTFTLKSIETEDSNSDDGMLIYYNGVMELPDIVTGDGEVINGNVEGSIILNEHGISQTNFEKEGYTDYDFVEGLEHEYDNFIHQVSIELSDDFYSL